MVPTVFRVSPQGDDVVIEGDLSGLLHASRCTDPEPSSGVGIERRLEQVFLLAMPLLWRSLQCVEGYDGTEFLGGPGIEGSDSGEWIGTGFCSHVYVVLTSIADTANYGRRSMVWKGRFESGT